MIDTEESPVVDEPPTLAEMYARAVVSSHLRLEEGRCDIDILIAAGWVKDGLGAKLYRLRGEFDTVRASVRRGPLNETELVLVLSQLKSLHSAKQAFGELAEVLATKTQYMYPAAVVASIAGRALTAWLDKVCGACEGRGYNGGSHRGERKIECRVCGKTGDRRANLGDSVEDRRFARLLLERLTQALDEFDFSVRTSLR